MSFLQKLQKGFEDTTEKARLEAKYLEGKKNGYNHPPQVEEHIEVYRGLRKEIPTLREKVQELDDHNKSLAESEGKAGVDFNEMIGLEMQHPGMAEQYRIFGNGKTAISTERFKLQAELHQIREEWKPLESEGLHDIKSKQDKANRVISDFHFYQHAENNAKTTAKNQEYEIVSAELIDLVHILRVKKESEIPGMLMRIASAEAEFFRAAAQYAEQVEAQLRNLGPITPIINSSHSGNNTFQPVNSGPPPPRPSTSNINQQVTARGVYAFSAETPQELSFNVGDILHIISQQGEWWSAELNGRRGLIPANYVALI